MKTTQNQITERKVSAFDNAFSTMPCGEIAIGDFIEKCLSDEFKPLIDPIREAVSNIEESNISELKKRLPAVTVSGIVNEGERAQALLEGRFTHSDFLQCDFDKGGLAEHSAEEVRDMLRNDPHIAGAFLSPSGKGAKAILHVPRCNSAEEHSRAFKAAQSHFLAAYGLSIDKQTKDAARLCFVSHDPQGFKSNQTTVPLPLAPHDETPPPKMGNPPAPHAYTDRQWTRAEVAEMLSFISRPNYDEWLRIASAVWNELGEADGTAVLEAWSPGETPGEYETKYRNKLERIGIGTLIHLAREQGWQFPADDSFAFEWDSEEEEPFPLHCLPGIAGMMAREIARVTTSGNEPLAAAVVLGILSASLGAGIQIHTGAERTSRGNLFLLVIAASGTGKGETYSLGAYPFEIAEAQAIEIYNATLRPRLEAQLKVAEQNAKKLCSTASKDMNPEAIEAYHKAEVTCEAIRRELQTAPRWKVADATKEALAVAMQGQPGEAIASLSSEARGIFSILRGRYGKEGGDEDFYCSAFSGDSLTVDRIGRDRVVLRRPCLSILWMIQPDAAKNAFNEETLTASGLLPRFLVFDTKAEPQIRYESPSPIPPSIKHEWQMRIMELIEAYRSNEGESHDVQASAAAKQLLDEYERENVLRRRREGDLSSLPSYVARWAESAWKIALILHAAENGKQAHLHELTEQTARDAIETMRWFAKQQLLVISTTQQKSQEDRLGGLLAVLALAGGRISFRDLRRNHRYGTDEVRSLISKFPDKLAFYKVHKSEDVELKQVTA